MKYLYIKLNIIFITTIEEKLKNSDVINQRRSK